jgi:hypothetical protein
MKCPECSGKGMVNVPNYRTNSVPTDQVKVKKSTDIDWDILGLVRFMIVIAGIVMFAFFAKCLVDGREKKQAEYDSLHPYITVQYASDGAPLHCWITAPNITLPTITGSSASMQVDGIELNSVAASLGVSDTSSCIRLRLK